MKTTKLFLVTLLALLFVSACAEIDPEEVLNDNTPPELAITSPIAGSTLDSSFIITANAADPESRVVSLTFYTNGTKMNTIITSNLPATMTEFASPMINIGDLPEGENILKVVAVNGRLLTTTRAISVTVSHGTIVDTTPPQISVVSPAAGDTVSNAFRITADTSDAESGISSVSFYANGSLVNTTAVPQSGSQFVSSLIQATNLPEGSVSIQVVSVNGKSLSTNTSFSINVIHGSTADTTPPELSILTPVNGTSYSNDFTISASSSDAESGVSSVAFYVNGSLIGTATIPSGGSTYSSGSVSISTLPEGPNTIEVVSKNGENQTTSRTVSITVVRPSVEDTVTMVLATSEPANPDPTVALDVLDPVFAWTVGAVTGSQVYRVTVWDGSDNCYFWLENVSAGILSVTYGTVPTGASLMMPTVDLASGNTYFVSIIAMDVSDFTLGGPSNEIGFAYAGFTVSGTRALTRKSGARPISRAEFEKRLAALQGR